MCNRKKSTIKMIPVFAVTAIIVISGLLKIAGIHTNHLEEMGLSTTLIKLLGAGEIIFSLLFLFTPTSKIGLLLLTAYFGGAMAAEIPYHQVAAPLVPLALVWVVAFIRQRSAFLSVTVTKDPSNLSMKNS
jgi:hypothetical protein